ncbi:MAG: hypothetical protein RID91_02710 [Azospirillaceae bacterium]
MIPRSLSRFTCRTALRVVGMISTVLAAAAAAPAAACPGAESPCAVADGRYYVELPAGDDGASPMPVIVWFHGWQDTGANAIANRGLVESWTDAGWLFAAADGREKTWAHVGSPSDARDDLAHVRSVIADIRARWPVDESRVLAAGFSQGGSMVWDVACRIGAPFTHFAPVSGAFWEPLPEGDCPAGPVRLAHEHGSADTVVPMEGRPIGDSWRQGDVLEGFAILRETADCADAPARTYGDGPFDCRAWGSSCRGPADLRLCLHDGGHRVLEGWSARTRAWVAETAPAR